MTTLGHRLRGLGPPHLLSLIDALEDSQNYGEFVQLVRQYVPDHEAEVMGAGDSQRQIWSFCRRFSERYFPIGEYAETYGDLLASIPVYPLGLTGEDYEDLDRWSPGYLLLLALAETIFEEEGAWVALVEECVQHVPQALLKRIPRGGYPRKDLHARLDGTFYHAAALFSDYLWGDTTSEFLNMSMEEGFETPDWGAEEVEALTRDWQEGLRIHEAIEELSEWLEKDPPAQFRKLLDFMEKRGRKTDAPNVPQ